MALLSTSDNDRYGYHAANYYRLFNSERFSDLIIRCDDRKWYAHKAVVCMQSEFFKKACEGEIKVCILPVNLLDIGASLTFFQGSLERICGS